MQRRTSATPSITPFPQVRVQEDTVDEQRDRAVATLDVGELSRRRIDVASARRR
jgi:hypothetical protein